MPMILPSSDALLEIARSLFASSDSGTRAALLAASIADALDESACVLHRYRPEEELPWAALATAGEISIEAGAQLAPDGLISPLLEAPAQILVYPTENLQREDYAHLHLARSLAALAYVPLLHEDQLIGAVEILSFVSDLRGEELSQLTPILDLAPAALLSAEDFERQRQNQLDSIHRLSQLYDLEKSLNSTLELDEVIAMIPEKTAAMLECQAVHLWLFDGGDLRLTATSGYDPTIEVGVVQNAGQGYVGDMAEEGEPLLIDDPEDERLAARNASILGDEEATPITTALVVALMQDGDEVGVLEAVNKQGRPFNDDDEFFLATMAETVSSALKNATLMHAERKLAILEALVHVSSEITSTFRLDRLLQIIVNSPQNVLPYERCSVALDNRGRLQLKAVSGMAAIPLGDAAVDKLHELLVWLSTQPGRLHLRQTGDEEESAALPAPVLGHFEATTYRAIYSLPLEDDQGRVGLLLYESSDPDFLDLPHIEMISILAGQATVAIRNALLYREVPLISLLEPLMQSKQALLRTSGSRRLTYGLLAVAAALFLIFCPLPMRVSGVAAIAPQRLATIAAPMDGTVTAVFVREGQRVAAGEALGAMNDWQWRMDLASAEARYRAALLVMENDLAHGAAQAGADRAQAEYLRSELNRARGKVEAAQLRSPIAGVVMTPALENAAGEHLDAGAPFAQVLDLSSAEVDIAIPQGDAALVAPGQPAAVKLDSYPQLSWHGQVSVLSPQAQPADGDRTFAARVPLPNTNGLLRSGMAGRGKVFIGWRPAGYVLLRSPALWIWQTLWNWIGW
jgi:GAF domain-containing protein